nr:MAG TPA: hypothetical protein [Caudoviricetes sp.]DAO78448.1 MAG TPA: hypothetical protein [Caudoviricetes sp.]DAS86016.1 MAG TPA: hypothetical protein [Caudoviricetes sp.]DAW37514.1 MAG TPA: hypothetical protein [Caudoviricetes sp.]
MGKHNYPIFLPFRAVTNHGPKDNPLPRQGI